MKFELFFWKPKIVNFMFLF
uniref:Uncharacterized protein n=1 Tax=Rhizophora mucronata TaxID=61149 RepID=A0A2P2R153_RHIMU